MNKKTIMFGLSALILSGLVLAPKAVEAYGSNYTEERHQAMEKAFENKDYNAWKNLMQNRGRATQVVNAQNFAKFAQAHEFAEAGKITEANQIRQELGLGMGMGMGRNWSR